MSQLEPSCCLIKEALLLSKIVDTSLLASETVRWSALEVLRQISPRLSEIDHRKLALCDLTLGREGMEGSELVNETLS